MVGRTLRRCPRPATLVAAMLLIASGGPLVGQQIASNATRAIAASGATLAMAASQVDAMLRDGTLDIARTQVDTMIEGRVHERLDQRYQGLPVFGGQLVRQIEGRQIVSLFGRYFDAADVPSVEPTLSADEAAAIAEREGGPATAAMSPELGLLPLGGRFVLAYRVTLRAPWDVRWYFVNATTGEIEQSVSQIRTQDAPAIGRGRGVLGDDKKVSGNRTSGSILAVDLLRPATAFTLTFDGAPARLNRFLGSGLLFRSDIAQSATDSWSDGAIVDAHVYQGWVYDYYYKRFGRRGLDDANLEVASLVHPLSRSLAATYPKEVVNLWINNAAYLHPGLMIYGDGDGVLFDYLAGAFDVVAHELTHGVTAFTSDLAYQDEPGALNEAFSDIMAAAAEHFFFRAGNGPQKGPNFLIGEDVTRAPPGFVRSLQNPLAAGDPDHYSLRQFIGTAIDNGGVHVNSTIVSHAFYLAVAGGTNRVSGISVQGIGMANMERMERVFYRAFAFFLSPLAQFSDARAATLQAAAELYGAGSNERAQLERAWTAVGVL